MAILDDMNEGTLPTTTNEELIAKLPELLMPQ